MVSGEAPTGTLSAFPARITGPVNSKSKQKMQETEGYGFHGSRFTRFQSWLARVSDFTLGLQARRDKSGNSQRQRGRRRSAE